MEARFRTPTIASVAAFCFWESESWEWRLTSDMPLFMVLNASLTRNLFEMVIILHMDFLTFSCCLIITWISRMDLKAENLQRVCFWVMVLSMDL